MIVLVVVQVLSGDGSRRLGLGFVYGWKASEWALYAMRASNR